MVQIHMVDFINILYTVSLIFMTLYLTQTDVESVLDMKSTLEAVEDAFKEMGNDNIEMPARVSG